MTRIAAAFCFLTILACGPARAAKPAWVQMTTLGAQVRVVTTEATCPTLKVDSRNLAMSLRAAPSDAFANRVCQVLLPKGAKRVTLDGAPLPLPKLRPNRLVIIGDTGCRLKGSTVQNCNDSAGWPFPRIAALAARRKPDLVIHVGDYYYRETPCPAGNSGCVGSPFGDRWPTWKAEVFDPAAPLLAAAPWVMTRGNHEDCKRGGTGWFRLFDAAPTVRTCPSASASFAVNIGGTTLLDVDSADTDDVFEVPDLAKAFALRLGDLSPKPHGAPVWIITHRPIWNSVRLGNLLSDGVVNATERAAVRKRDLGRVQLVLSGHVHNFASLDFGPSRPPQLVVGDGGDLMAPNDIASAAVGDVKVDGLTAKAFTMGRFGYFVFDRDGADWAGKLYDVNDAVAATCRLHGRSLSCALPK